MHKGRLKVSKGLPIAACTLLALLTVSGCKHDPNVQKRKYFESGERYEKEGKLREAAIQFSNALKVDRNYSQAHYALAKTYLQLGSVIAAYQELQRTVALNPSNVQARIDLGNLLLGGGLPDRAKEQAKAVLAMQPNNADAFALLSRIAARQGNSAEALTLIQHALSLEPNRAAFHTALGMLEASSPDGKQAGEAELQKAVSLNPKDPGALMALAVIYARQGDIARAEQQAQTAVSAAPDNMEARVLLAQLYMRGNNQPQAEQTLIQGVNAMPDKDQPANLLLSFYGQTRQVPHAESVFADLSSKHPRSVPIQVQYARVLIMENKFDQAGSVVKQLSRANSNDPHVQRLNAELLLHAGKTNDALMLLQKAVNNAPDDVQLHLLLAQAASMLGRTGLLESNLTQAAQLDPRNLAAARGLAQLALSRGDMEQLTQLANKAILLHPDAPEGYVWRGTAEARRQQFDDAENDFETALKKDPTNEIATLDLGELHLEQKKIPEGSAMLEQVLARDPDNLRALNPLVDLDLQAKQPEKALALVQAQIAKSPNNPALYTDLSALQLQLKDLPGALASAQHALSISKLFKPAIQVYSEVELAAGNPDAAISVWQQWSNAHPDDAAADMRLGVLEQTKGDVTKAVDYYKKSLAMDSSQAVAANNLAFLMVENGDNTDVALSYAETARRDMPNSPDTADTLAWVYYHKGTYSLARDLLEDAVKAEPNNVSILYHLGMTYSKLGDKADAVTELKKAASLGSDSQAGKQAADALNHLG